jgi:hypothetical protein
MTLADRPRRIARYRPAGQILPVCSLSLLQGVRQTNISSVDVQLAFFWFPLSGCFRVVFCLRPDRTGVILGLIGQ